MAALFTFCSTVIFCVFSERGQRVRVYIKVIKCERYPTPLKFQRKLPRRSSSDNNLRERWISFTFTLFGLHSVYFVCVEGTLLKIILLAMFGALLGAWCLKIIL